MTEQSGMASMADKNSASDEVWVTDCEPCNFNGTRSEARFYCRDCPEFLCDECARIHRGSRRFRKHSIVQSDDLPNTSPDNSPVLPFQFCDRHKENTVDSYCFIHKEVLCPACKTVSHSRCKGITDISELCRDLKGCKEERCFLGDVKAVRDQLRTLQLDRQQELDNLQRQKTLCLEKLSKLRETINMFIDQLEVQVKQKLDDEVKKESRHVEEQIRALEIAMKTLEDETEYTQDKKHSLTEEQLFIIRSRTGIKKMEEMISDIRKDAKESSITFTGTESLSVLQDCIKGMGELAVTHNNAYSSDVTSSIRQGEECVQPTGSVDFKSLSIVKVEEFNVRDIDDQECCGISGATYLSDGRLVVCDYNNQKLKLLDQSHQLVSSLRLPSSPWDVAPVSDKEVAVTLPGKSSVRFVTVQGNVMKLGRQLSTGRYSMGVAYQGGQLYVSCNNGYYFGEGEVVAMDLKGRIKKRHGFKKDGTYMFRTPEYLAVSPGGDCLYVSDGGTDTVVRMNASTGQEVFAYRDPKGLKYPQKLLVGPTCEVYVCSDSNSIQVIEGDGQKHRAWVQPGGAKLSPWSLAFRGDGDTLAVGGYDADIILVYSCRYD